MQNDLREAVGRLQFFADGLSVSTIWSADRFDNQTPFELIRSDLKTVLALLSARPLALGGQHSTATDFPPDDVLACVDDTVPAQAEAQDEGAAPAWWIVRTTTDHPAGASDWIGFEKRPVPPPGVPGFEVRALYAHPSPTPAADDDRVRIAVEALEVKINAPLTGPTHGAWDRGRIAGLKEALAALKSTAAKEGGEG